MKALARMRREKAFQPPKGLTEPAGAKVYFDEITPAKPRLTHGRGATWFRMDEPPAK